MPGEEKVKDEKGENVFDFIVRRALEPDNHPDTARTIKIYTKEQLQQQENDWLEYCQRLRREEDPIERYCYDIREEVADYEISFREQLRLEGESEHQSKVRWIEEAKDIRIARDFLRKKPEEMTKTQWTKEKRKRKRLEKEEIKQQQTDSNLKQYGSPLSLFSKRVKKIGCRCEAEAMRRGIFCDTCRLLVKVDGYMLDLFKNASQGRTSIF
jgi:hypothetical protein